MDNNYELNGDSINKRTISEIINNVKENHKNEMGDLYEQIMSDENSDD
jgi:effector-binding domain-containing protein